MITISSVTIGLTAANPFINLHANKEMYPQILFTNTFTPHDPARSRTSEESTLQTGHQSPTQNKIPYPQKSQAKAGRKKNPPKRELRTRKNPSAFPFNPQGYGGVKIQPLLPSPCHA
jgi:hypothetical protein